MDKQGYIHYCQILIDKLDAIQRGGLSTAKIHDINADRGLLINNIANIDSNWFDGHDENWKKDYYEFVEKIIKRVEDDLISFISV